MKKLFLLTALALSGCASMCPPPVKIPVAVKCHDTRFPPQPIPDTSEAVKAIPQGDMEDLAKLLTKGRVVRDEQLAEDEALIKACSQ